VVDFIDFHIWPLFNLADSAIVIGVLLVVLTGVRRQA
jgi:signal peptidase II